MAALEVIHVDVVMDGLASLPDIAVLREIGFLIFECPEPPLNLDVVGPNGSCHPYSGGCYVP